MRKITVAGIKRRLAREALRVKNKVVDMVTPLEAREAFPAGYLHWLARRSDRLSANYPGEWKNIPRATGEPARVAVVMHVFYQDLVPQILEQLAFIPVDFDLIVTNSSGVALSLDTAKLERLGMVTVLDIENRGRDILPLVSVVNADLLEPYELVLKVHTKKSAWREEHSELSGTGEEWRDSFFEQLLGSTARVESILNTFSNDPTVGLITSQGNVVGPEHWGGNLRVVDSILKRLELTQDADTLEFAAGSIYWIRGFLLQGLRAFELSAEDFEEEDGRIDSTAAHALERIIGIVTKEAGYSIRDGLDGVSTGDDLSWKRFERDAERPARARAFALYLPQFHAFPENNLWWGKGFTEWSNVAAAKPVYRGQAQPLLPADLGFYDLTTPGVRAQQYALAEGAGIEGFMYYYYWFAGKKLMSRPIDDLHASTSTEKFSIMWANENWTRRWDGRNENVLIGQDYESVPATEFIHDVLHLLKDERYTRVGGKPLLAVYRITQVPEYRSVLEYWQKVARDEGLGGLHLVAVDVGTSYDGLEGDLTEHGMDAYMEFAPHNMDWEGHDRLGMTFDDRFEGNTFRYKTLVESAELALLTKPLENRYPGVMVNYDNTARRQWQPDLWYGSNPYTFRRWLNSTVSALAARDRDDRIVFINAWNEWAESAVLEPTQRYGKTYLLAVRDVLYR